MQTSTVESTLTNHAAREALDNAFAGQKGYEPKERKEDDYRIRIPNFEGPLDLLLHLIRKDQLNIYDIPVAQICRAYLEHLERMRELDVDIAGEFMVMAATLTHLKSILVLPNESEDLAAEDPRLPLVQQLLQYEQFKRAAQELETRNWLGRDIYARPAEAISHQMPVESLLDAPLEPIDMFQLLTCLKIAQARTTRPPIVIQGEEISIREKVATMAVYLEESSVLDFTRLLPENRTVKDIIISFLAVLELAKLKYVEVIQLEAFGPIQIRATRPLRELNVGLLDQF